MSSDELRLISLCAYLTDISNPWRSEDHTASKMVKALKGDEINGHFFHVVKGQNKRFDQANISEFLDRIPPALARMIARHVDGPATLVPIPNSHVTAVNTPNFRTLELAKAVAAQSKGQLTAAPALVFKTPQHKSRAGGKRSPQHFEAAYRIAQEVKGPIVLLDDVCTSGGHLIGAHWKLQSATRDVVLAAAFGRSTKQQLSAPIGPREEILLVGKPPPDLPEIVEKLRQSLGKARH
jgi:hypothetical protein